METNKIALAHRLREVLLNGTWIANTNFKEQITGVSWKEAIYRVEQLNSIAMLTYHINYYIQGLLEVLRGGTLTIHDQFSFDLPDIRNKKDWEHLTKEFLSNAELFARHVEQMDDQIFSQTFVDEKYGTYLRIIEGVIEHSYYHLGQVALIRKLIQQGAHQV